MRIFVCLVLAATAVESNLVGICQMCKCSMTDIRVDDLFISADFDHKANNFPNWRPVSIVYGSSETYLSVKCVRGFDQDWNWPPVRAPGITAFLNGVGVYEMPELPEAVKRKLLTLSLSRNRISSLTPEYFSEYIQLKSLNLHGNSLHDSCPDCFSMIKSLLHLDLSGNEIRNFGTWSTPSTIKHLDLSQNRISTIDSDSFEGLHDLIYLDISDNLLTRIPENFGSLPDLKIARLTGNQFEKVPRLPRSLVSLNMSFNSLTEIVLPQIDDLVVLDVSHNKVDDLDNVYGQINLKVLRAGNNNLSAIAHWNTAKLEILDLSYNNFPIFPPEVNSDQLPVLQELYLDGNPVNEFKFEPETKPFPNLNALGLSNMGNITSISRASFSGLILESYVNCTEEKGLFLNLSTNKIKHIDSDSLRTFPICSIDLSRNHLSSIPEDLFHWKEMNVANLQSNPWDCVCEMQWMLDTYLTRFYVTQPQTLFDLRCRTPSRFKDKMMVFWYNSSSNIFCRSPSYFRYEYADGKYFEMWTASMITSIVLAVIIFILIIVIVVLLLKKPKRAPETRKNARKKPLFRDLRGNTVHKYNEISQEAFS